MKATKTFLISKKETIRAKKEAPLKGASFTYSFFIKKLNKPGRLNFRKISVFLFLKAYACCSSCYSESYNSKEC